MEFFAILKKDRKEWMHFWDDYKRKLPGIMIPYCAFYHLDEAKVCLSLERFSRPFLDRIYQKNETIRFWKAKAAKALSNKQEELKLVQEDFTIYMIGALGLEDRTFFPYSGKYIGVIDIVSVIANERIEELPSIAIGLAKEIRSSIDRKETAT